MNLSSDLLLTLNFSSTPSSSPPLEEEEEEWGSLYRHSSTLSVLLIGAYGVILTLGVVGNGLVVGVVLRSPRMRTVTNLFILNLAVADLLVVLFCLPPTLLSNILVPWVLGRLLCKTVPYVQGVSVSASVYSLVAVSLDRCSAIWFPLGGGFSRRKARGIIVVIWVVSAGLALPWALTFEVVGEAGGVEFCVEEWPEGLDGDVYFLVGNVLLCYLLPLAVISLCYLLIWLRVATRDVPTDSLAALQKIHQKAKMGVLRMLVVVVLVFLLSWLPLYVLFARVKLGPRPTPQEEHLISIATPLAQWLGSSNSALNPVIYAALNVKFRRAFRSLLPRCCGGGVGGGGDLGGRKSSGRVQTSVYNVTTGV